MKIALVASVWISIPPKDFGFGAQEYLQYYLAEELTKKGHDVTLFATGDSKTQARLIPAADRQISDMPTIDTKIKDMFELMNLEKAYEMAGNFDIIHNHLLPYGLLFEPLTKTPTVHTLHHQIYKTRSDVYMYQRYKDQKFISISEAQKNIMPELNYISTVYNGVDTSFYPFKQQPTESYIVFIGRMRKYKGIHTAIHVAQKLQKKLKILSPLPRQNQADYKDALEYFDDEIKPHLNSDIEHIDFISGPKKVEILQNAKLLLFPVEREEPFGMTVIETGACGVPTVAYAKGSMPELIADGKTGFLVDTEQNSPPWQTKKIGFEGLCTAVERIFGMPEDEYRMLRKNTRAHVAEKFSIESMVDEYEKVYREILGLKS